MQFSSHDLELIVIARVHRDELPGPSTVIPGVDELLNPGDIGAELESASVPDQDLSHSRQNQWR